MTSPADRTPDQIAAANIAQIIAEQNLLQVPSGTTWSVEETVLQGARAAGASATSDGRRVPRAGTLEGVFHRLGTADASGTTTISTRKNGTEVATVSIVAPALTGTVAANVPVAVGDIITHVVTVVGVTPGLRLTSEVTGVYSGDE
jgi:hypothetical protein